MVFHSQQELNEAFKAGELDRDFVAVVRFQGPKANGMPELHKLTTVLGVLQDRGQRVALVTDGRMSGASGKVPAAIHVTPEAVEGGPIGKIRDGDIIRLDADAGTLEVLVEADDLKTRLAPRIDLSENSSVSAASFLPASASWPAVPTKAQRLRLNLSAPFNRSFGALPRADGRTAGDSSARNRNAR